MKPVDDLTQLVYVSTASSVFDQADVGRIARRAASRNRRRAITGLLLYSGGHFMQLLEGPRDEVDALYELISMDPRHHDLDPLLYRAAPARLFRGWSMGALNVDAAAELDRSEFQGLLLARRGDGLPERVIALLLRFRELLPAAPLDERDAA